MYKLIDERDFDVTVIGGPHISVADEKCKKEQNPAKINMILDAAFKKKIKLYLKKYGRENHHYIVSADSDKVALLEDPHLEHKERGTSVIYNSKVYCDNLRHRFGNVLSKKEDLFLVAHDSSCLELQDKFKTASEFSNSRNEKESHDLKILSDEVPWIGC